MGYEIPDADPVLKDLFRGFAREKPVPKKLVSPLGRLFSLAVFEVREIRELEPSVGQVADSQDNFSLGASYGKEEK